MRRVVSLVCVFAVLGAGPWRTVVWAGATQHQATTTDKAASAGGKTAEQQFKNIKVLKDVPAEQLIPTMQFIAASLGVECEFCHVEHEMEKDDKKDKQTARKMIEMELAIDKYNFDGDLEVTCYTCHRGSAHPVGTPILSAGNTRPPAPHVHEHEGESDASLPSADEILNKYLAAVGGAEALQKIKTRVQKGTIDALGHQFPIEVYSEGPDKRVSISHPNGGSSVTAFNGAVGWLTIPNGVHRMTPMEREGARIDARLYFPLALREMYREFKVQPGEEINGQATYLLTAKGEGARPDLRLYFNQQDGLLVRQVRYAQTPLGKLPTQVDYADYRATDGVKIAYQWTLARPNGSFVIRVTDVQQNVPVDEKLFMAPSEEKGM